MGTDKLQAVEEFPKVKFGIQPVMQLGVNKKIIYIIIAPNIHIYCNTSLTASPIILFTSASITLNLTSISK